jgi:hypothetical protein
MNAGQAKETLEVIRTLMERTCQYRLLAAWAGIAAGSLAGGGALLFLLLDPTVWYHFLAIWGLVFAGSLLATIVGSLMRGRERGERVWSRQARTVVLALSPALLVGFVLTLYFFLRGEHLVLPGIWMLCYGQGALATSAYAPASIGWLGLGMLLLGTVTLWLPGWWPILMMGLGFGVGHLALGVALLISERYEGSMQVCRSGEGYTSPFDARKAGA